MKGFLLSIAAFLAIFLVLNLGYYQEWFQTRPVKYWTDFVEEREDTSGDLTIRSQRYGFAYTMSLKILDVIQKKKVAHPVILFEPNSYYRDSLHIYPNIRVPEPSVFYYYTGLEGVWTNSPNVARSNYLVRITKKGASLDTIRTRQQLQEILARYKKYPPIL